MSRAYHLQNSAEHATPRAVVEASRRVLGGRINVDPATTKLINAETVQAERIYTATDSGLDQNWRGTVFLNPPGGCPIEILNAAQMEERAGQIDGLENSRGKNQLFLRSVCGNWRPDKPPQCSCKLVKQFWHKLIRQYLAGITTAAIWIGFSVEQLQSLQIPYDKDRDEDLSPLDFALCFPSRRLAYLEPSHFEPQKQPPHASYVCYLGPQIKRFRNQFSQFGAIKS